MNQNQILLGTGHFGWPKTERQKDTWARILLTDPDQPGARHGHVFVAFDPALAGRRGRLVAHVTGVTDRPNSGTPDIGQEFDLGTGSLTLAKLDERPGDGLTTLGLDGHTFDTDILYHLHTHWVELRLEVSR
ncbi:hypothetical protein [Glycomyces salinus]|uniref:hypothetical protein n=1 Tax=Glycomyces salinus TaxID=980294 RepID=UPI0018ED1F1C|nr:hypothetical protein [Glycomyces salinus]